jgi:hypothetical protein
MAKVIPSNTNFSGTIDDKVYVKGKKGQHYVRKKQKEGLGRTRPTIVQNFKRTGFLNGISSSINRVIKKHNPIFHQGDFYTRMNICLRTEPSNHRFLLLRTLKNLEVNTLYPLHKLNFSSLTVTGKDKSIEVRLQVINHPDSPDKYDATCYDYELILFSWNNTEEPPLIQTELSPWIYMHAAKPTIIFNFDKREGITHWVLFLRQRLGFKIEGRKEEYVEAKVAEGMQLVEVGSFDEADLKLLEEKQQAIANMKRAVRAVDNRERRGIIEYDV